MKNLNSLIDYFGKFNYSIVKDVTLLIRKYKKLKKKNNDLFLSIISAYIKIVYDYYKILEDISNTNRVSFLMEPDYEKKIQKINVFRDNILNLKNILYKEINSLLKPKDENSDPIMLKVMQNYNLSSKELIALCFVLLYEYPLNIKKYCNYTAFVRSSSYKIDLYDISCLAEFDYQELIWFINNNREHMKDELLMLDLDSDEKEPEWDTRVIMPKPVQRALMGYKLTEEELVSISETKLLKIISQGRDLKITSEYATLMKKKFVKEENEEDEEDLEEDEDWEEEESMDEIEDELENGSGKREKGIEPEEDSFSNYTNLEKQDIISSETISYSSIKPYISNLDYLNEYFLYLEKQLDYYRAYKEESFLRREELISQTSMVAKIKQQKKICDARLKITLESTDFVPNLEKLVAKYELGEFEKMVIILLVAFHLSPTIKSKLEKHYSRLEVGQITDLFSNNLEEKINLRKHFYKNSNLVKSEIILLDERMDSFENMELRIDPRVMDYILGLDIDPGELVEGSILYTPKVNIENVILPEEQKNLIMKTVESFEAYQNILREIEYEDILPYGRGLVILFYGPSGTGKTMMANALANYLGKRIFLINFPKLRYFGSGEILRQIFREAKIRNSLLFLDECEQLFKIEGGERDRPSEFLTEIEKYDGILIMATNKPSIMDEAIQRRINLAVEFRVPDPILREKIWAIHLPKDKKYLSDDIDLKYLARKYEISGGFIKNAILMAMSMAVSRDSKNPVITQKDLDEGAKLQLISRLKMIEAEHQKVAEHGLESLVLPKKVIEQIEALIEFEKASKVLFGQWGFDGKSFYTQGTSAIFYGPPGTGKTFAAEAIAYELGRPIRIINTSAILSMWVGETSKNIENVFKEAEGIEAILVFDDAESLFGRRTDIRDSTDRYANIDVSVLLYHLENYKGVVILTTNRIDMIDEAFFRRFRFTIEFTVPDKNLRRILWEKLLPSKLPLSGDVNLDLLAERYLFTGGQIRNTIFRASAKATLKKDDERVVTMEDLERAAEEEKRYYNEKRIGF